MEGYHTWLGSELELRLLWLPEERDRDWAQFLRMAQDMDGLGFHGVGCALKQDRSDLVLPMTSDQVFWAGTETPIPPGTPFFEGLAGWTPITSSSGPTADFVLTTRVLQGMQDPPVFTAFGVKYRQGAVVCV